MAEHADQSNARRHQNQSTIEVKHVGDLFQQELDKSQLLAMMHEMQP